MPPLGANNSGEKKSPRSSSMTVVGARNAIPEVINHAVHPGGAKRHNMTSRHHSVDTLTVAPGPRSSSGNNVAGSKQVSRYQGTRRARELEQHLRDKYGLPEEVVNNKNKKATSSMLRRTNSHSSLTQFSTESIMRQHHQSNGLTLTRRKSAAVFEPGNQDYYGGPKSYTHLRQHHVAINEPRDSKLRYLGRMSPEEQVDKYLKSVEKINEARLRQMQHQQHQRSHHRVPDYQYYLHPSQNKINTSMMSSRWHSLDSVSRPVIVKNIREMKSGVGGGGGKSSGPSRGGPVVTKIQHQQPYREKNDLKSYTSMPQISHGGRNNRPRKSSPNPINNLRKASESSEGKTSRDNPEAEPMSTSSDHMKSSRESTPATAATDDHDSCSCTDVTLDETLRINHNHRKSMARKKKLQAQRLMELQKAEELSLEASALDLVKRNNNVIKNDNHLKERGISANYLGSITLDSKSSDLLSLQKPLKSLYFKYVIAQQAGLSPTYGNLAITNTGLKVRNRPKTIIATLFLNPDTLVHFLGAV